MKVNLLHGDCMELLKTIESGSVDAVITDPPYGNMAGISNPLRPNLKGKHDWDVTLNTANMFKEIDRVLRKNGKAILFAQDPYSTELKTTTEPNLPFNYGMTWLKNDFANALLCKKAPVNYTEDILVFSKTHDYEGIHPLRPYFEAVYNYIGLSKREIFEKIGQRADHVFRFKSSQFGLCTLETYYDLCQHFNIGEMEGFKPFPELLDVDRKFKNDLPSTFNLWDGKKYKSNVLEYKKDYTGHHPTQKPVLLMADLVKTYTNENDIVLDFTMGIGSTGVACINTNRRFIGIERDDKYFNIAKERITKAGKK